MQVILNGSERSSAGMSRDFDLVLESSTAFKMAVSFAAQTYEAVIIRMADEEILPFLHTQLVFYRFMLRFDVGRKHWEDSIPWRKTARLLNHLLQTCGFTPQLYADRIPNPERGEAQPLPEDFAMRGLLYTSDYFADNWFNKVSIGDNEMRLHSRSTVRERQERILWLGRSISLVTEKLCWNARANAFSNWKKSTGCKQRA